MTAILFPGQGAQYVGMGREIAESWPVAREFFERADEALGLSLTDTLWNGSEEEVNRTDVCQPGILTVSAAITSVLEAEGLLTRDDVAQVAGLSLGEYTAHWYAGTFSFEDAVRLVRKRGEAMQAAADATASGMAAIMGPSLEEIEAHCAAVREDGGVVVVANLNAPGQVVISGEQGALDRCCERLTEAGARRVIPLPVAGAFHSPVMAPASAALAAALETTAFVDPSVPVVSNVTAEPVTDAATARGLLAEQVVSPVLFERSLRAMIDGGLGPFVEPGPGRALAGFLRKIDRKLPCRGYDSVEQIRAAGA